MSLATNTTSAPHSVPADSPETKQYSRIRRWLAIADAVLGFVFLVVLLVTKWNRSLRDIAIRWGHDHYAWALFLFILQLLVATKLIGLPLDIYGFHVEHRFHLSNQKVGAWIWDEIKGLLVGLVIGAILAELVYWAIRTFPQSWWLVAWAVFIVLFIFFAQIAPVLLFPIFYKFLPLKDEELKSRLVRLSERAGTKVRGVYEWKLSEKSKKANAALTGLGHTRRIILADTLLQNYTHDEIEAVLAHELGHHVRGHIVKSIVLQTATTFVGFWLAKVILRAAIYRFHWYESQYDFANLPLLLLITTVLSLLLMPALNAYSRHNEREADLYCWKNVPSVSPFITAMNKLSEQNLSEKSPSRFVEWMFHSHPAVAKRIRAAESYVRG